ncbi:hypothetical protein B0H17DRAFT_1153087 [Mycena rosella]|uniref:MYND-type domain-containing protein n=1 Tax=Mycena rosella TaxID=1033263 RepID=A0AAD7B8Z4_MYCRO|nr:hypothetical protein B0H17DRAFT_1153087 [Mycena rosella]
MPREKLRSLAFLNLVSLICCAAAGASLFLPHKTPQYTPCAPLGEHIQSAYSTSASAGGSLEHLKRLRIEVISTRSSRCIHFLPAFYANLNPANIPNIADLEEQMLLPAVRSAVERAGLSLSALLFLDETEATPQGVYPYIFVNLVLVICSRILILLYSWPRAWAWTNFFDTSTHAYGIRVTSVSRQIWGMLIEADPSPAFEDLCSFIGKPEAISTTAHIEEFAEGCGGTLSDLAQLVVKHITSAGANLQSEVSRTGLFLLHCGLEFVVGRDFEARYHDFYAAIVSHGIVAATIHAVNALEKITINGVTAVLQSCFLLLDWTFHDLVQNERFVQSEIFGEWQAFKDLFQERLKMLTQFNSGELECHRHATIRITQCGAIHIKTDFMRCSGCLSMYYCSKECQRRIECTGPPGLMCPSSQTTLQQVSRLQYIPPIEGFSLVEQQTLTMREKSFLRALMDHDYMAVKEEIFHRQVKFMRANPCDQFYVVFEYSGGGVSITVKSTSDNPGYSEEHWEDYTSREEERAGRMELHLLEVGGFGAAYWMIPMRSDSSKIEEGLEQIAATAGLDEIQGSELQECPRH